MGVSGRGPNDRSPRGRPDRALASPATEATSHRGQGAQEQGGRRGLGNHRNLAGHTGMAGHSAGIPVVPDRVGSPSDQVTSTGVGREICDRLQRGVINISAIRGRPCIAPIGTCHEARGRVIHDHEGVGTRGPLKGVSFPDRKLESRVVFRTPATPPPGIRPVENEVRSPDVAYIKVDTCVDLVDSRAGVCCCGES